MTARPLYLGDHRRCPGCDNKPCRMPPWVLNANGINYPNNPERQRYAIAAFHEPVTTLEERLAAKNPRPMAPTFSCTGCGRYAFPIPGQRCYWCKKTARSGVQQ